MLFNISEHVQRLGNHASAITYSGSTSAVLFWGLHLSDVGVIVSSLASVCGVAIQFYVARKRFRNAKHSQETQNGSEDT